TGQVLTAAPDRTILFDQSRAGDTDQRRQLDLVPLGPAYKLPQHSDELPHGLLARHFFVAMTPALELYDSDLGETGRTLVERDDAGTDIGAADIDRKYAFVTFEHPGGQQMNRAHEAGFIGVIVNYIEIERYVLGSQQKLGAGDRDAGK